MRYDAFISYSHTADNVAAPALQKALHAFARPWNRMRALHVFRDQTSLAASPELWPAIEAALADSRWLLLMASPEAAASRWVAREIEWWLTQRTPQTMLILLTGGSMQWDPAANDFDWQRTTCLPHDVLSKRLGNEPLWVDLSWAKSADVLTLRHARFRGAVLDIAAPLHNRPKDELDGEDVRRFAQFQRVRAGAIATVLTLVALASAAGWVAFTQRHEARRQTTLVQAGRLGVQADQLRERGDPADASVMLAAEALRMLDGIGERSADVDQSLRRALAGLPTSRATLEISADELRLTPDGTHLVATRAAGGDVSANRLADGVAEGCTRSAIGPVRQKTADERFWQIDAVSDDAGWCVVHVYFPSAQNQALELWSAAPLRQVTTVRIASRDGHVRSAVAPGGAWLAATDVAQSGDASAATVSLYRVAPDGNVDAPEVLPQMAALGFAPDGRYLATSAGLWRLPETGAAAQSARAERWIAWDAAPSKIAFARDSAHVATQTGPDAKVVIWEIASRNDVLRASPPAGELLALAPGGKRLIVTGARDSVVWDAELDVGRARLPYRADTAGFVGHGRVLFVIPATTAIGIPQQQLLALPEDPAADQTTMFPGDPSQVQALHLSADGAHFAEYVVGETQATDAPPAPTRAAAAVAAASTTAGALRLSRWDRRTDAWLVTTSWQGVTAFTLAPDGREFAATIGGRVSVGPIDGAAPLQPLAPDVAARTLAFSADQRYALAFAPAADGGTIHVWSRADGAHWSAPIPDEPSALAVTRDGRTVLAISQYGTASRAGTPSRLLLWRRADTAEPTVVELGRSLTPPGSICAILRVEKAQDGKPGGAGVTAAELPECSASTLPAADWSIVASANQARVFGPSGAAVARIDHAARILFAALSPDGREAVTLDESGVVLHYPVFPNDLIAQACAREPALLPAELRALLPAAAQAVDACGKPEKKGA